MPKKLFVGNLSFKTTQEELSDFVAGFGINASSVQVITHHDPGWSRGFGFIVLDEDEDLDRAVEMLNKQPLDGRVLIVNEAQTPRPSGNGRR